MRDVLTHIAWKNHANGARNHRAQYRSAVPKDRIDASPKVAGMLGVLDCSGVADGAAAGAYRPCRGRLQVHRSPCVPQGHGLRRGKRRRPELPQATTSPPSRRLSPPPRRRTARQVSPARGGRSLSPRCTIASLQPSSCSWRTSGFSARGEGWQDVVGGAFDFGGDVAVNVDGGLKWFGHPVGATGLRMSV